ncbi:LytTR family DNA-binding domain-containing protein [Rhizobium straminoryzae]|uniref:LytTR family transcriptional regulator n=1 Tax=Rhizobium straminoryzae TaxID=1387186 RepID=A0A549T886_9HYPH|nr:LytTR family DNA-binding domain-containing protein [Rhizobium straminoryzae]TRL38060.1 LytTR family transcriptional regulator [Rhizobium straminoryzae]
MNAGKLQSALRELQAFLLAPRYWLTVGVVVAVFTISGPFGTLKAMPLLPRLAFWLLLHGFAFCVAMAFAVASSLLLAPLLSSRLIRMMIGSALAALPIAGWIVVLQAGFVNDPVTLAGFTEQVGVSVPLCLIFCVLTYLTTGTGAEASPARQAMDHPAVPPELSKSEPQDGIAQPAATQPALLARLKPENRGRLLRLSVQDHYTEVVTSRGRELILLRFADALNETGNTPGRRIHRSHWVADAHVESLKRDKGRLCLVTGDGTELPVSRPYEAEVRHHYASSTGDKTVAAERN